MAIVSQPQKVTAEKALNLVNKQTNLINKFFRQNDQTDPPLDATYKSGRVQAAKDAAAEAHARLSWALNEFSITPLTARTDAEMIALDSEILEFDDGT